MVNSIRTTMAGLRRLGREPWPMERISAGLGLFAIVFILAMTVSAAWKDYAVIDREARDRAQSSAFFLSDHASRLFETADIALRATMLSVGSQDWSSIETSSSLRDELKATVAALPYVQDLWLNDDTGRLRLTTFAFPTPLTTIVDRTIFRDLQHHVAEPVIGERIVGRVTGAPTFLIARRLDRPDGGLRGIVSATTDLGYFNAYWAGLALPNQERIALVRDNGALLIGRPEGTDPEVQALGDGLRTAAADSPEAGRFTPAPDDIGFYHRVGTLPLYVTVVFSTDAVLRRWSAGFWRLIPFPVAAMLAVIAAMALNLRRNRAEALARRTIEAARHDLSVSNARLEDRVAERTADLRETNAEIQRFAYIVSHDLRAPLVNIDGFTTELQMLRDDLFTARDGDDGQTVADFDEAIGFIRTSIDKMDRLINAILLLSRQAQRPFQPVVVDMDTLMRAVADVVAHRTQKSGVEIVIGRLPFVIGDPIGLEQIFTNLIDNAVKYLRRDVPGRIEVAGREQGGSAIFTVKDNGRGIDPRDHARVFDLFRRAGVQDQPGEGIGLAHVRALVRRLGGGITLDSTPGSGSTFTIALPLVAPKGPQ